MDQEIIADPKRIRARTLGARRLGGSRWAFRVWAPEAESVALVLDGRAISMARCAGGCWEAEADAPEGTAYQFRVDGGDARPDPASLRQPGGVHAPSALFDPLGFPWTDQRWQGLRWPASLLYELHIGTFTEGGTFDSAIERLDDLADLGVDCVEVMPIASFPGRRNWGYDGVYPFAAQESYGGPEAFQRFVDACHARSIGVCLDVVYNHFGPEGNYLWGYGPYFTSRYQTPWGDAVNFDGPHSDGVRDYFLQNALMWLRDFHVDALRLDATHAIFDTSARPFLRELAAHAAALSRADGRERILIAESEANDPTLCAPPSAGGYGLHAQWCDDFHHGVHTLLTGESDGYYNDYGSVEHLAKSFRMGYRFTGGHSKTRGRAHGRPHRFTSGGAFVACVQNHDQIGNRKLGERRTEIAGHAAAKLATACLFSSPLVPMLFMGEEHGESNPFLYFVDHGDKALLEGVRAGRKEEFAAFAWKGEPPDPASEETFRRCIVDWSRAAGGAHKAMREQTKWLAAWRRREEQRRALRLDEVQTVVDESRRLLLVHRGTEPGDPSAVFNFSDEQQCIASLGLEGFALEFDSTAFPEAASAPPERVPAKGAIFLRRPCRA